MREPTWLKERREKVEVGEEQLLEIELREGEEGELLAREDRSKSPKEK